MDWIFAFACAAYNLVRLRNLAAADGKLYLACSGVSKVAIAEVHH